MPQTRKDIPPDVKSAYDSQQQLILDSSLTGGQESVSMDEPQKRSARGRLRTSVVRGATLALRRLSIWLRKAALSVTNVTLGYLNSTILTLETRLLTLRNSSPMDSAGAQKDSELRLGNAVSFAPTAIGDILWNSKSTTPTPTYEPLCREFMTDTISPNRLVQIRDGIEAGTIDFATVSVEEYLQVSFLMLYHGEELHIEQKVMYGGGRYNLHACVSQVVAPGSVTGLRS